MAMARVGKAPELEHSAAFYASPNGAHVKRNSHPVAGRDTPLI